MMTLKEFNKQQDMILAQLPTEFHEYFSSSAYEQGHSCGHEEVLNILRGDVGDFLPAFKKYEANLNSEITILVRAAAAENNR